MLLVACSDEPARTTPERKPRAPAPAMPAAPAASPAPEHWAASETGDPADVLRRYYALIEAQRYPQAYALREPNGNDVNAFAAHFERFASHQVTVGAPSEPAEADGWLYVEVPVQSYGSMKDGTPFGSAGTVTLRRRDPGGEWRIFTKG